MASISSVLHIGPGNLISEYEGGLNFNNLGTLSTDVHKNWGLAKETCATCAGSSIQRLDEIPLGTFRNKCILNSLVNSIESRESTQLHWCLNQLPDEYSRYSDKLLEYALDTGKLPVIRYIFSIKEDRRGRELFRKAAVTAVTRGQYEVVKFLCTYFDNDTYMKGRVNIAIADTGDIETIKWFIQNNNNWDVSGVRRIILRGNLDVLKLLLSRNDLINSSHYVLYAAIGGNMEMLEWVLENNYMEFDQREVCLMTCSRGNLEMFKHLVVNKGFYFNRVDCKRFAKRGSGIVEWIDLH